MHSAPFISTMLRTAGTGGDRLIQSPTLWFWSRSSAEIARLSRSPGQRSWSSGATWFTPYAEDGAYEQRLVKPYSDALPRVPEPQPEVLAIPGNHDWYDGLVWFRRLFCSGGDFAAWKTRQSCSYFAARLPYNWWILGLDTRLRKDIDARQARYFHSILDQMTPSDRVIICYPEPPWLRPSSASSPHIEGRVKKLEARLKDSHQLIELSGDIHNYQRSSQGDRHRVVCGTGGAFLHPTHFVGRAALPDGYRHEECYPGLCKRSESE